MERIVITGIARTPQGNLLGSLKEMSAPQLGAIALQAAITRSQLSPSAIQETLLGCVLPAGLGQAPARQAAIAANIPVTVPSTTLNKVCGSGMKAIMLAHDMLKASAYTTLAAGGMESMSNAPYLLLKARGGYRLGHGQLIDHMMLDGLEDAYDRGRPMGYFAEQCAKEFNISRAEQDHFSLTSLERALKAIREKSFSYEIAPVSIKTKHETMIIDTDERPPLLDPKKIATLPAIFAENGTITAGNSCSIADGAAALIIMKQSAAEKQGITPLATILAHSSSAQASAQFPTAPINAIKTLLETLQWKITDVDLFEINEAFAVVPLAAMKALHIPHEKLNIHGGGCAIGHPIGATGARIVVTLIAALKKYGLKKGIASLCIGGGEATAIAVEV